LAYSASGGTLSGVSVPVGIELSGASSSVTLNNTTIAGDIRLSGSSTSALIQGLTTFTTARLQNTTTLNFAPGYTLNAPVIAEGAATGARTVRFALGGVGDLTIAPGASIRLASGAGGTLNITDSSTGTLINNGSISNEASGRTLTILSSNLTNNAVLSASGGQVLISSANFSNFSAGTLTGGTYSATAGGSFAGSFVGVINTLAATVVQDAVSAIWASLLGLRTITLSKPISPSLSISLPFSGVKISFSSTKTSSSSVSSGRP
jgi:hypothetical protein